MQLAALASVGAMLFTGSTGDRIFLPFCLCILTVSARILAEFLKNMNFAVCACILLTGTLVSFYLISEQLPGYLHNYDVDLQNRADAARARQTGVHYYCIDYDEEYTHIKAYNKGYFYNAYLESEGLDKDKTKVYFYSRELPAVYVEGERAISPAFAGKNGEWLLPLRSIIEAMGGSIEVQKGWANNMEILFDDRVYHYRARANTVELTWEDEKGQAQSAAGGICRDYFSVCMSEKLYEDVFGLHVTHSSGRIDVTRE